MNIGILLWILSFTYEHWGSPMNILSLWWILGVSDKYWGSLIISGVSDEYWGYLLNIGGIGWILGVSDEYLDIPWQYQSRYSCGFVIIIFYSPLPSTPPFPPRVIFPQTWGFFSAIIYRPLIINIIPLF